MYNDFAVGAVNKPRACAFILHIFLFSIDGQLSLVMWFYTIFPTINLKSKVDNRLACWHKSDAILFRTTYLV